MGNIVDEWKNFDKFIIKTFMTSWLYSYCCLNIPMNIPYCCLNKDLH